ncbi:DASS family sodium-coupled anion symporter [Rhodobacteraceae bacterium DSL-40]|uniref:SLC13 family permease n=1 Tax=Amaricoccus sp. B4 TaxID=3368557 RepID=UPI000DADEB4D
MAQTHDTPHQDQSLTWTAATEQDQGSLRLLPMLIGLAAFFLLLALPAPEGLEPAAWRLVAVAALMVIWWITEAIPIAATSMLPLALFPLTGVSSMKVAAAPYASSTIFLFMGGFMLAGAMERWNLHRRIALSIVSRTGACPHHIVGGFMVATAFLSMWVSNTATTVMMLPIAMSVIGLMRDDSRQGESGAFALSLMLGIAYAASIGGIATLIGTPPNALLAGAMRETYGYDLGFGRWMLIGVPIAVVMLGLSWLFLTRVSIRLPRNEVKGAREMIQTQFRGLGPMTRAETAVGLVFLAAALLWIFRTWLQNFVPGLDDAAIAIGAALLLFLLPAGIGRENSGSSIALLDWTTALKLPWGVLLLFGGGLSLAAAVAQTGLDTWIGGLIGSIASELPILLLVLIVSAMILLLTEVTSNTATAATFLPLLAALSQTIGQNPLMLAVPAAISASMAFMLPVATPPNALVFSSGRVTIPQMVRHGGLHNIAALMVLSSLGYLLLTTLFGVQPGALPVWAAGR